MWAYIFLIIHWLNFVVFFLNINVILDYFLVILKIVFIFNMLQFGILDFFFIAPYFLAIIFLINLYFQFNTASFFVKGSTIDKKFVKSQVSKKNNNIVFVRIILALLVLMLLQVLVYHGFCSTFWCNHFIINNFIVKYLIFFLKLNLFIFFLIYCLMLSRVSFSIDYLYSIVNILIVSPILFLSNNFFVFYFILEFIVCLTFFKFAVSRFWYKSSYSQYKRATIEKYADNTPKMFINALFFQYWVSFFSSILLLFFFINLEFYFNSTEWIFLNLTYSYISLPNTFYLYFYLFICAFFLKLGVTPFHLYKVEVYKGLPYISIYIYTLIFFFIYFNFFLLLMLTYFFCFLNYFWFSFIFIIILGTVYVISMLFDVNFLKGFFAYSTIINSLSFLLVALVCF